MGEKTDPALPGGLPGDLLCLALAHELKNDVFAMQALFELIGQAGVDNPTATRYSRHGQRLAASAGERIGALAGSMLEDSRAVLAPQAEGVEGVARRAIQVVTLRNPDGRPAADLRKLEGADTAKTMRPHLLELVLTNLVQNAARATPQADGLPQVEVRGEGGGWRVTVSDAGGGLPESARRVLEGTPGALTEVDFERVNGHWGLGLLLVRAAALAAGWRIELRPLEGGARGSAITVAGSSRH